MPSQTLIPGQQVRDSTIQRIDLDVNDINSLYPSLTESRAQHAVLIGPIYSDGPATFRPLDASDVPTVAITTVTGSLFGTASWANTASVALSVNKNYIENMTTVASSVAIGKDASATQENSIVIGDYAGATQNGGIVLGNESQTSGVDAIAIGAQTFALQWDAVALGAGSQANHTSSVALGALVYTTANNQVKLGTANHTSSIDGILEVAKGITGNVTGSVFGTASWAVSASCAITASYAMNGGNSATTTYNTIVTSSAQWITCSFLDSQELVNITIGQLYHFTCSNIPTGNNLSEVSLLINNTATQTSSLSFPSNWTFLGSKPNAINSSKNGILSLRSYGSSIQVAGFSIQY